MQPLAQRYHAFWIPGLINDLDRDDSLKMAFRWLRRRGNHRRGWFGIGGGGQRPAWPY